MRVGKLKKYVDVQVKTNSHNSDTGEVVESWSSIGNRWASIEPLSAREFFSSNAVQSNITHKINLRYIADNPINEKNRIVWNSRTFNIDSVINIDEANIELVVLATEVTDH